MRRSDSILIVEDNPDMAEIYRDAFESLNYAVTIAHSGQEALEALEGQSPGVLMMDLMLPDMGWRQLLEAVRVASQSIWPFP
jgi:CheY-like chemotaxis protein